MIQITINDSKEVEIKTTKGLEETKLAANAVIEIMRNAEDQHEPKDNKECNLEGNKEYNLELTWINDRCRLEAVKEIKENLGIGLKEAKCYVWSYLENSNAEVVLLTGSNDEVTKATKKFDGSEYVKVRVSKR